MYNYIIVLCNNNSALYE